MEKLKEMQSNFLEKIKTFEDNLSDLSLEQLKSIQSKLKSLEEKLKSEGEKVKTITISEFSHKKIKRYCVENALKINEWVENQLLKSIENSDKVVIDDEVGTIEVKSKIKAKKKK